MTTKDKKRLIGILTWVAVIGLITITALTYRKQAAYYDKSIAEKKALIYRLKREAANKPKLTHAIAEIDRLIDESKLFIRTPNRQAADAELLSQAKKIIETAGGKIQSVTPISNRRNKANNSRVDISLTATHDQLIEIISKMAASKPLMNVTQARLVPIWKGRGRQRQETGNARVQLQVEAFFAAGANQ